MKSSMKNNLNTRTNKLFRIVLNIILGILGTLALVLIIMASYHHISLSVEKRKIELPGTLVEVDGYRMNVYTEGKKKTPDEATLVLLSGSGVSSPVYDYKVLYSKLSGDYRVAVLEKFGYGYSDISGISRDVATLVEENREALVKAGETAPYILMPHSMSALEAIYWAHTYPEEIKAIIGLDMAVPQSYDKNNIAGITLMKAGVFFGFHRFEFFNPISRLGLTDIEYEQNKMLNYRNALNRDVYNECKVVLENTDKVRNMSVSDVPLLMFTTNLGNSEGSEIGSLNWIKAQRDFAESVNNSIQIQYDCGHNLHYYKSDEMAEAIREFLNSLRQ